MQFRLKCWVYTWKLSHFSFIIIVIFIYYFLVKPQTEESERQPHWRYIAPKPKPADPTPQKATEVNAVTAPNMAEPPSANASPQRRQAPTVAPKQAPK